MKEYGIKYRHTKQMCAEYAKDLIILLMRCKVSKVVLERNYLL